MLASCSSLSLTCRGLQFFLAGGNEATAANVTPFLWNVCVWLIGMCKNQFQQLSVGWEQGKLKVEVMNTREQVLLNKSIPCLFSFAVMDYAPQASSVPATLFVAAGNTMERLASGNGRAVKCKSVCVRHPLFVLLEQMDVSGEPKANFSCWKIEQIKPDVLFFLPSGTHIWHQHER